MTMTVTQSIITIAVVVLATMATRFGAFLLFPESRRPPAFIHYLGRVLPLAITGMLVVYSLKDTSLLSGSHGIPELISLVVLVVLYRWRRNSLLAILVSTVLYMALVQVVFV